MKIITSMLALAALVFATPAAAQAVIGPCGGAVTADGRLVCPDAAYACDVTWRADVAPHTGLEQGWRCTVDDSVRVVVTDSFRRIMMTSDDLGFAGVTFIAIDLLGEDLQQVLFQVSEPEGGGATAILRWDGRILRAVFVETGPMVMVTYGVVGARGVAILITCTAAWTWQPSTRAFTRGPRPGASAPPAVCTEDRGY